MIWVKLHKVLQTDMSYNKKPTRRPISMLSRLAERYRFKNDLLDTEGLLEQEKVNVAVKILPMSRHTQDGEWGLAFNDRQDHQIPAARKRSTKRTEDYMKLSSGLTHPTSGEELHL